MILGVSLSALVKRCLKTSITIWPKIVQKDPTIYVSLKIGKKEKYGFWQGLFWLLTSANMLIWAAA